LCVSNVSRVPSFGAATVRAIENAARMTFDLHALLEAGNVHATAMGDIDWTCAVYALLPDA
jgi:hypothetical protein